MGCRYGQLPNRRKPLSFSHVSAVSRRPARVGVRHLRRFRAIKNFSGDVDRCAQRHPLKRSGHALLAHKPAGQKIRVCHPNDGARRDVFRLRQRQGLDASVVNTALSCASVNSSPGDVTAAG